MNKNALKRQQRNNLRSGSHALRGVSAPRNESKKVGKKKTSTPFKYKLNEYEGIRYQNPEKWVETHPEPRFTKTVDYPHQKLQNPSHLWCDVVTATDADVRKGNAKR